MSSKPAPPVDVLLWLLADAQGSTRQMASANGYVQTYQGEDQHFQYDSFGNYVSTTIPPLTNLRFAGELMDPTGLIYLRARYYDPATGRFTRPDPFEGFVTVPQSLHKYLYCNGDPVNGYDPSGYFDWNLVGQIGVWSLQQTIRGIRTGATWTTRIVLQHKIELLASVPRGLARGYYNQTVNEVRMDKWSAFGVGFLSGAVEGLLSFSHPHVAVLVGSSILNTGNVVFAEQQFTVKDGIFMAIDVGASVGISCVVRPSFIDQLLPGTADTVGAWRYVATSGFTGAKELVLGLARVFAG